MTLLTEGQHAGEFLVSEATGTRARAAVTVVAASDLAPGTVLGMVTGTGVYTAFNPDAQTGEQTAIAILWDACEANSAGVAAAAIVRDAEVNGAELVWPDDLEAGEQTAALAQLAAVGIIVR